MEIKLIQLKKYNKAKTQDERNRIEMNPRTILFGAIENCTPLLYTQVALVAGTEYTVWYTRPN